jgi:hypothetical protein
VSNGWEWPAPDAPRCGAVAEDLASGKTMSCLLRRGHKSQEHHWEEVRSDELVSATWIATGEVTVIGSRAANSHPRGGE